MFGLYDSGMPLDGLEIDAGGSSKILHELFGGAGAQDEDPAVMHRSLVSVMKRASGLACYAEVSTRDLPAGSYQITRVWKDQDVEAVPDRSPWLTGGVPVRSGGVVAEIVAFNRAIAVNRLRIEPDDPAFAELGEYQSVKATPGAMGEGCNWVLVLDKQPDAFTVADLEVMSLRVKLVGLTLKNLGILKELRQAKRYIDSEVDRIARIQRALLPSGSPTVLGLEVAADLEMFDRAGGDAYDYADLPDERWAFLVSDASGHGPAAAVISAILNAILHTLPTVQGEGIKGPGQVLEFANGELARRKIEQAFVTAFVGMWDPQARTLTYARAGHNPPMLRRRNGEVSELKAVGDVPLAIFEETTYEEATLTLETGDMLLVFSDGIVEAADAGGEMLGEQRLAEALRAATGSAAEVLGELRSMVRRHETGVRSRDDQTMMVLKVERPGDR